MSIVAWLDLNHTDSPGWLVIQLNKRIAKIFTNYFKQTNTSEIAKVGFGFSLINEINMAPTKYGSAGDQGRYQSIVQ